MSVSSTEGGGWPSVCAILARARLGQPRAEVGPGPPGQLFADPGRDREPAEAEDERTGRDAEAVGEADGSHQDDGDGAGGAEEARSRIESRSGIFKEPN